MEQTGTNLSWEQNAGNTFLENKLLGNKFLENKFLENKFLWDILFEAQNNGNRLLGTK